MDDVDRDIDSRLRRFGYELSAMMLERTLQIMRTLEEHEVSPQERWQFLRSSLERFRNAEREEARKAACE